MGNPASPTPSIRDMKEGLSSTRKPDITHVRTPYMVYPARNCEYGSEKYVRGNFMRPVSPEGYTGTPTRADFERLRSYYRAALSHLVQSLDAMERYGAMHPPGGQDDIESMRAAAYAVDTDPDTTGKTGPSFLPHIGGTCASLNMAITQAVECGLLPADPGQPWRDAKCIAPVAQAAREYYRRAVTRDLLAARVASGAYDVEMFDAEIAADFGDRPKDGATRSEGVRQ